MEVFALLEGFWQGTLGKGSSPETKANYESSHFQVCCADGNNANSPDRELSEDSIPDNSCYKLGPNCPFLVVDK